MSTGSNNIVVTVADGVDGTIAPKIRDIANAARDANSYLVALQNAVNNVSGGTGRLSSALGQLQPKITDTATGTSRLEGAFAQLTARVAGAEAGLGMIGGALGRVAVAAGLAGPLIVAALAVVAVGGAILIYEKMEEAALKVVQAQADVAKATNELNDGLLKQHETLIGLTQGSLARYRQELTDLPLKSVKVDIADLNKEWKDQDSFWSNGLTKTESALQRIIGLAVALSDDLANDVGFGSGQRTATPAGAFGISDATKFVAEQEKIRQEGTQTKDVLKADAAEIARDAKIYGDQRAQNNFNALQNDLVNTRNAIRQKIELQATQTGAQAELTGQGIRVLQEYYQRDLIAYTAYLNEKKLLEAGANGDLLAEQRKAAEEELRTFNEAANQLKNRSGVVTPQQTLFLRQSQLAQFDKEHPGDKNQESPFASVRDTLTRDIGNAQQAIERQNRSLDELIQKYKDEVAGSGAYSNALKTEVEVRKVAAEVQRAAPGNVRDAQVLAQLRELVTEKVRDAEISKEEIGIYNEFEGPILKYNAALSASARLLSAGAITSQQAAIADAQAAKAKQDSLNPLNEYVRGLQNEIALLGQYGIALTVASEVERVRQELQNKGRDLTGAEIQQLSTFLDQLERQKQVQQEVNNIYNQTTGAIQKLIVQQEALNTAKQKGIISEQQYQLAAVKLNIELANQALLEGKNATLQDQLIAGFGKYVQNYQGLAKGLSDAYGEAFKTIADGAANSLGRAIAYGENLGNALRNVAREVVSGLISAFIKLGIQWLEVQLIGEAIAHSALAAAVAQAQTVAAAWAPAAAFASLASFGANAAPAAAAISGTVALSDALALFAHGFAYGGPVIGQGTSTSDSILAKLSNGEYVVNARAAAQYRSLLDQINYGSLSSGGKSSASAGGIPGQVNVSVIHDGSTAVAVHQMSDGEIRIIAKQEAQRAVEEHGPRVIASDLQNPNSRTSKAILQTVDVKRRR